jgi:GT2 family glycosyltransferase
VIVSLIVCTYKRPKALQDLLESIRKSILKPNTILVIDGSPDDNTKNYILNTKFDDLVMTYYKVLPEQRGLTNQRNFGIEHLPPGTDIVAFLDDDIIVEPDYFDRLLTSYHVHEDAIGVGGLDLKDNPYFKTQRGFKYPRFKYYELDGWAMKEPLRNMARKLFCLMPHLKPGLIPEYSHGRSTLPPNGLTYPVEHFMGGISSYKKELFDHIQFSDYFKGYGLYEDFDFCLRVLRYGKLYVNTEARVWHYHETSGRPDFFKYGKMVINNGWYVWRVRFPNPSLKARFKWHATALLLAKIRLLNVITGPKRKDALMDFLGRITAWLRILYHPPVISE